MPYTRWEEPMKKGNEAPVLPVRLGLQSSLLLGLSVLLLFLFLPLSATSYEIKNIQSKVKSGQLPKYCLCAGYPPPACSPENRSRYENSFGEVFLHIHHYCWGLDKLNLQLQSVKPSPFWLENAINEFDYVLSQQDPKKSMHAEIWTKKGQVFLILKKKGEAVDAFYNAIKSNKHYVPAYLYLSQLLKSTGDQTGACRILAFGTKNNPDSKQLKQMAAACQSK